MTNNATSLEVRVPEPSHRTPEGDPARHTRNWRRKLIPALLVLALLVSVPVVVDMASAWLTDPQTASQPLEPRTPQEIEAIISELAERGQIPAQAAQEKPKTIQQILEELVEQGKIPAQTLDR